ncbi:hypothetical protein QUF61_09640 [Candidatus Venteria ishoeyi]|uniref:hypothetical protein n=1 Tax=Candidatus Venteria ishoeyi TaxID=1899563 RepID=UPI0025A503FB|nr:hypothetical protein [Candidatus Venteria ishoeyi]MDM8546742.1 hypothetical protein [Candidatus Venteria ishoeyi]
MMFSRLSLVRRRRVFVDSAIYRQSPKGANYYSQGQRPWNAVGMVLRPEGAY